MNKRSSLLISSFVSFVVVLPLLLPAMANADGKTNFRFQYAAKFVCGWDPPGVVERVIPGQYATAVAIHNPNRRSVTFRKKLTVTFPPHPQEPGPVSDFIEDFLGPNHALQVDCEEIRGCPGGVGACNPPDNPAGDFFPAPLGTPYIQGFLIIESERSLDVTAAYTAGVAEAPGIAVVGTIAVEQIRERRIGRQND